MVFKSIKKFFKKNWRGILVGVLAFSFFAFTAGFNYIISDSDFIKFSSPDGAANYTFSKLYSQTGELTIFEKYNLIAEDIIHPRSISSEFGSLKPVSFLGIILIFGKIASFTSYKILPYLTPFFASIAIVFFYLLVEKIFRKRNALISTVLLTFFPPFIYYTARSMFHNVLFVSLLIIGLYFVYLMGANNKKKTRFLSFNLAHINWKSWVVSILAGIFIGLAICTRTSELLWLLPVFIVLWVFNIKKIGITKLVLFLASIFICLLPVMYWNQILYSNPFYGGYPEMNQSISSLQSTGGEMVKTTIKGNIEVIPDLALKVKDILFYFGFNPELAHSMFYYYFANMFPWIFWLGFLGIFMFLQKWNKWQKKHLVYILAFLITSFVLIYYYGSWKFHDNPNQASHTIGNSYTRYWLPVYLGALPFVSIFIGKIPEYLFPIEKFRKVVKTKRDKNKKLDISLNFKDSINPLKRRILLAGTSFLLLAGICYSNLNFTLFGSEESLSKIWRDKQIEKRQFQEVMASTENNSVIITLYHDKLLFPERKVIVGLFRDDNMIENYSKIAKFLPVYYYNFTLPDDSVDYLNNRRLPKFNLKIKKVKDITDDFTLYRLNK